MRTTFLIAVLAIGLSISAEELQRPATIALDPAKSAAVDAAAMKAGVDLGKLAANVPLTGEPMTAGLADYGRLLQMAAADAIDVESVVKGVVSAAFKNLENEIAAHAIALQKQNELNTIVGYEVMTIQAVLGKAGEPAGKIVPHPVIGQALKLEQTAVYTTRSQATSYLEKLEALRAAGMTSVAAKQKATESAMQKYARALQVIATIMSMQHEAAKQIVSNMRG